MPTPAMMSRVVASFHPGSGSYIIRADAPMPNITGTSSDMGATYAAG